MTISNLPIQGLPLSPREREVLALVAEGLSDQAIARRLHVSVSTAKGYMVEAREKLGARNRPNFVHLAHLRGLLGEPGLSYDDGWQAGVRAAAQACGWLAASFGHDIGPIVPPDVVEADEDS